MPVKRRAPAGTGASTSSRAPDVAVGPSVPSASSSSPPPHAPSSDGTGASAGQRRGSVVGRVRGEGPPSGEPIVLAMPPGDRPSLQLEVDGRQVEVADRGATLLEVLREDLGLRSAKDGCSPQGQCGCCTVLVDGQPRVACVTPARRVAGRSITTVDGLPEATPRPLGRRLLRDRRQPVRVLHAGHRLPPRGRCRQGRRRRDRTATPPWSRPCSPTSAGAPAGARSSTPGTVATGDRSPQPRARRSTAAGRRSVDGFASWGRGAGRARGRDGRSRWPRRSRSATAGFADDTAPAGALVAVPDGDGGWAVGETLAEARAGRGQGAGPPDHGRRPAARSSSRPATGPPRCGPAGSSPPTSSPTPPGASPAASPSSPLANGGAFGGKQASPVGAAARDAGRPARPPGAGAARPRGRRAPRAQATAGRRRGRRRRHRRPAGGAHPGHRGGRSPRSPPAWWWRRSTSPARRRRRTLRAAGWAEALVLLAGARGAARPRASTRRRAPSPRRPIDADGTVRVRVDGRRPARRGRPAVLRHRRRPHGAVVGVVRGHRRGRRRRGPRPHDPLLRHPAGRRHARRSRSRSSRPRVRRSGPATPCSRRWPPPPGSTRARRPTGRPAPAGAEPTGGRLPRMSKPVGAVHADRRAG